jgi:cell surface protein SprA
LLGTTTLIVGCRRDDALVNQTPPGESFEISAWDYATDHFFVDTLYRQYYEDFYNYDPPIVNPSSQIVEEEVWGQRLGLPEPNDRICITYISLLARGAGYDSTYRHTADIAGRVETARLFKLERTQFTLRGDGYLGVLSLDTNIQDQQIIAIAYKRADGIQFGEFERDAGMDSSAPLILKMVKPRNLNPSGPLYLVAWNMLVKNVYDIGITNVKADGFYLDIFRQWAGRDDINAILNEPLLRILGLDRYDAHGVPTLNGDGQFDFRPAMTIDQVRGEIIFPTLRPFDDGIREYFESKGQPLPDTSQYLFSAIYDTVKASAKQSIHNRYVIRGRAQSE